MMDMGAGAIVAMYGSIGLALWGIPAFLLEGVILKLGLLEARAFLYAFIMNLVSTIIGYFTAGLLFVSAQRWAITLLGIEGDPWMIAYAEVGDHTMIAFLIVFIATWALSVVIEGGILSLLEAHLPKGRLWTTILIANLASYIPPSVFFLYWISQNPVTV
jgi:hypothetical protein